jgi:hypothetical protein
MNTRAINKINQKLEPVIITYNRAEMLKKTLSAFMQAGFSKAKIHVLDIVACFQKNWPQLIYHRNPYNIGGNANILRSLEITDTDYHWVIGDDDTWLMDNKNLTELSSILEHDKADLIRLGWLVPDKNKGTLKNVLDLNEEEDLLFCSLSMISSVIIKRQIVCQYLPQAYQNIANSYPQLVSIICSLDEKPIKIYSLAHDLMRHQPSKIPNYFMGDLEWFACWFRSSRIFTNPILQKKFISEIAIYSTKSTRNLIQFLYFLKIILYFKSFNLNQTPYLLSMIGDGKGQRGKLVILAIVNSLFPNWLAKVLRKIYYGKNKTLHFDRSRL